MLEFNLEHKAIDGTLKNNTNKLKIKNIIIGGLLVSNIFFFSGCAKNVDCSITDQHAHNYVNDSSFDKYVVSEKEYIGKWFRTEDYIVIDDNMEELIEFENENKLYRISNNKEKIDEVMSTQTDYMEYRYKYTWLQPIPHCISNGKTTTVTYTYIPKKCYSWTTDENRDGLTGETRMVHYMYYGYKVEQNEKGKMKVVKSKLVETINDLPDDFIYIKSKFYKKVDLDNKNQELSYEDGPEEEKNKEENSKNKVRSR